MMSLTGRNIYRIWLNRLDPKYKELGAAKHAMVLISVH